MKLDKAQIAKVTNLLTELLRHTEALGEVPKPMLSGAGQLFFASAMNTAWPSGPALSLNEHGRNSLGELVTLLFTYLAKKVGEKAIEGSVVKWLKGKCLPTLNVPAISDELMQDFVSMISVECDGEEEKYVVVTPVVACSLPEGQFKAFGLVFSPAKAPAIRKGFDALSMNANFFPGWYDNPTDDGARALLKTGVVCLTPCHAKERGAAIQKGEALCRLMLGILNLVFDQTKFWGCRVCLEGDDHGYESRHFTVSVSGKTQEGGGNRGRKSYTGFDVWPLSSSLHRERLTTGWSGALNDLCQQFLVGTCNDFVENLVTMWAWLGRAYMAHDTSERFLFTVVALEAGLAPPQDASYSRCLAAWTAALLGKDEKERETIEARVRRWYGIRSRIVHSGIDAPGERDLTLANETVIALAKQLVERHNEWNSAKDFRATLTKLTGVPPISSAVCPVKSG